MKKLRKSLCCWEHQPLRTSCRMVSLKRFTTFLEYVIIAQFCTPREVLFDLHMCIVCCFPALQAHLKIWVLTGDKMGMCTHHPFFLLYCYLVYRIARYVCVYRIGRYMCVQDRQTRVCVQDRQVRVCTG